MPYIVVRRDDKWMVYKEGADKEPVGDALGEHDSEDAAQRQQRALYASDADKAAGGDMDDKKRKSVAVKALNDTGRIGGYLVVWGDAARRDLHGEYFTKSTELGLDWYPRRPVLYQHGLDDGPGPEMIGQIESMKADDVGVWVEAQLDLRNRWARAAHSLVGKDSLGWSSGSLPHLVQVTKSGQIVRWPIVEGSLTPSPAEPRHTEAVPAKHYCAAATAINAYKSAGLDVPDVLASGAVDETATTGERDGEGQADANTVGNSVDAPGGSKGVKTMTISDEVRAQFDALVAEQKAAQELADLKAKAAQAEELEKRVKDLESKSAPQDAPAKRLPGATADPEATTDPTLGGTKSAPQITVGSKFDNLDVMDLAYGVELLRAMHKHDPAKGQISEQYANALAAKTWQAGYRPVDASGHYYKDDELSHSTQSSYGDEWVPELYSGDLWRRARVDNPILGLFRAVEMPSDPYSMPIEGTDPTVNFVPETTNESQLLISGSGAAIPDSKIGSGKVQLDAKKLALRVGFSSELVEDSIIPILPIYREQAQRSLMDAIDHVLLNGDTTATSTGNINLDDNTPAATAKYMAFNGLRKLALVTNTANGADIAGGPTLAALRNVRFLMAAKYSLRPSDLAWIVDGATYGKLLGLNEVVTMDKFGANATAMTGQIGVLDGIPVLVSAEMPLTEADGKVSNTGSNNTKGQAVCVYRPGWVVGYRRRIAASVEYLSYYDAYQMTATMRVAFVNFDTDVAAVAYDITV